MEEIGFEKGKRFTNKNQLEFAVQHQQESGEFLKEEMARL